MIALVYPRRYWQLAVVVICVGVAMAACHARDNALRAEGAMREQLKALTAKTRRDSLAERAANTVVERDTVVLTKWVTRYDTVRHTLNIHDTVQVVTYIQTADSTIRACREAVGSLTTLCQRKDSIIADLRRVMQIQPRTLTNGAGWKEKLTWGLAGLAVGAAVDRVTRP